MIDFIFDYGMPVFGAVMVFFWIISFVKNGVINCINQISFYHDFLILASILVIPVSLLAAIGRRALGYKLAAWYFEFILVPFVMIPAFIIAVYFFAMLVMHLILNLSLYRSVKGETVLKESDYARLLKCLKRWHWYHRILSRFRRVGINEILLMHSDQRNSDEKTNIQ